ncbi:MAG: hypothetical protein A2W03_16320 [Candidatus Aminicenantes bacterium RBG_16_63_16]|nr:MAG: hypothetical protein A2W03_16320 [Candidatus Aminicenantes bacterium RBG_16_63_16]
MLALFLAAAEGWAGPPKIELKQDEAAGRLAVIVDGREAFVYQYAPTLDLPHYWPLNSPGGKNMLVEKTEPYPHHRSFWIADTVRLAGGREVSVYNGFYSGVKTGEKDFGPPFRDHVRHVKFTRLDAKDDRAEIGAELVWEMDKSVPVLKEARRLRVDALGAGEYFLDLNFALTAAFGDVDFVSDEGHYAWPFLRLETRWSGDSEGTLISDLGAVGEEATNLKPALWLNYSNTVEGETAGIAVFQWPDGQDHRWLTRKYGCFGPRRPDDRSGEPFTLKKGESISQRVGVLVHRGDVNDGRVAERYRMYIKSQRLR